MERHAVTLHRRAHQRWRAECTVCGRASEPPPDTVDDYQDAQGWKYMHELYPDGLPDADATLSEWTRQA